MSAALKKEAETKRTLSTEDYRRYLPIVRRTAMRLARKLPAHISVADLIGYAWVGLIEAFGRTNDGMSEEEFEAYALYRIRGSMLDHLRSLDPATRASRAASRKVTRAIATLQARLGRAPEEEEIAKELGMAVEEYRATLSALDRAGMSRIEVLDVDAEIPADAAATPENEAGNKELKEVVAAAIGQLPERLRTVLQLYYGEECTLREIGAILEVSESRVCQLHTEAVHRLRAAVGRE
jgi:RNA polymerase sigma factor for flagellar operon FliA